MRPATLRDSAMKRVVRVGLVQQACFKERARSVEHALEGVREAARQGAEVVCLPELFAGPYFCQVQDAAEFDRAESLDGETLSQVSGVARELQLDIVTSVFERRAPGVYHNTLVHIDRGGDQRAVYRKMHIPHDPQFEEKYYFAAGDGFVVSDTADAKLGLLVCWDQWYPEAARLTAMLGAELLFYPTAIGWMPEEKAEHGADQLAAWQTMQRSHAIANGVFVVAVNRVGIETSSVGSIEFWGHSFVCAPNGRVLAEAGTEEAVLVADCDLNAIESIRRVWPFFRDRRIDAYEGLLDRWG